MPADSHGVDFQALYDGAACGLLLTSRSGDVVEVNAAFCKWIGYSREELVGRKRLQDLLSMGAKIFHQTHWYPLLEMQGSVAEVSLEFLHRDGHKLPMLMNGLKRGHDGTIYHEMAVMLAADRHAFERELIKSRKEAEALLAQQQVARDALAVAEARLRQAIQSAGLYAWDVDLSNGARRFDDGVALLLGYPEPVPVSEELFSSRVAPPARDAERLARAGAIAGKPYELDFVVNGVDERQRILRSIGAGVEDASGKIAGVFGVLQDVTDASTSMQLIQDRALFTEQMIGIVSHDLRNPLAAILTSAHVLERSATEPPALRIAQRIRGSGERAIRLIEELLDFTQARIGGGLRLNKKPVDLHQVVSNAIDELRLSHPGRLLAHAVRGSGYCRADADRVTQLVGNLVSNALHYGNLDSLVTIETEITEGNASLSVHNLGRPIEPELLSTIFQPMVRGASGGDPLRNVGLGLFIVAKIAEAHLGSMTVSSSEESGTRFELSFPRDC